MSRSKADKDAEQLYRSVPQGTFRRWSGRQHRTLKEQSLRYGFEFGETIDLTKFVRWFSDFLSANAWKLAAKSPQGERTCPNLAKWRRERARLAELQRMQVEGELVPLAMIVDAHNGLAELMKRAIERLEKRFGVDAAQIMRDLLDDYQRKADEDFGDTNTTD